MRRRALVLVLPILVASPQSSWAVEETEAASGKRSRRDTLDVFHLSKQPKLRQAATPTYPAAALEQNIAAAVTLLIDIDERGEVTAAALAEPVATPGLGFEEAALGGVPDLGEIDYGDDASKGLAELRVSCRPADKKEIKALIWSAVKDYDSVDIV